MFRDLGSLEGTYLKGLQLDFQPGDGVVINQFLLATWRQELKSSIDVNVFNLQTGTLDSSNYELSLSRVYGLEEIPGVLLALDFLPREPIPFYGPLFLKVAAPRSIRILREKVFMREEFNRVSHRRYRPRAI